MPAFRIVGLDAERFAPLFSLSDAALHALGARRRIADTHPGFPCRVSLEDAEVGDELLLLNLAHHEADSPYRASGPVFVRRGAQSPALAAGEVPPYVTRRLISLRAYDAARMMVAAAVCEGPVVAAELERLFADPAVEDVHLHNARQGCYSCKAVRV